MRWAQEHHARGVSPFQRQQQLELSPTIVPETRQNSVSGANASQLSGSLKCLKRLDLLGTSRVVERQNSV